MAAVGLFAWHVRLSFPAGWGASSTPPQKPQNREQREGRKRPAVSHQRDCRNEFTGFHVFLHSVHTRLTNLTTCKPVATHRSEAKAARAPSTVLAYKPNG